MKRLIHPRGISEPQRFENIAHDINEILTHQVPKVLTDEALINWFIPEYKNATVTLKGNRTLNLDSLVEGDEGNLVVHQDVVGNRILTVPSNSMVDGVSSTTLVLGLNPNDVTCYSFYYDGATIFFDASLDSNRIVNLENNELKITYYEIVSGASGSLTITTNATINQGEFGLSGNAVLSKIDGSNKPTFESPKTAGGAVVTASLNTSTGAWASSGTYTDLSVALIYSIKIKTKYYSNLTYSRIIESEEIDYQLASLASVDTGTSVDTLVSPSTLSNSTWAFTTTKVLNTVLSGFNSTITWARVTTSTTIQNAISLLQRQSNYLQSTRFISGAGVAINADPTKFNIQVEGEIVDINTFAPTAISVNLTGVSTTHIATQAESFIWIDNTGTVIQSLTPPNPIDLDSIIGYWVLIHSNLSTINVINSFPYYADGVASKVNQILYYLGFSKFKGTNIVSSGTTGTRVSHTGGNAIKSGGGNAAKRPVFLLTGATDATFRMRNQNDSEGADTQTMDVGNIDIGGVTTALANNNRFGAHKVWKFSSSLIRIQRGQKSYANYDDAIVGISIDAYVDSPNGLRNGVHIGWIVFRRNTSWGSGGTGTDGSDYKFVDVGINGSTGSVLPTMQASYNISGTPKILISTLVGAIDYMSAMATDAIAIMQWKNIAGTVTAYITGAGVLYRSFARSNMGNTNYSILSTDQRVYTGNAFTTARTATLPTAASVFAGTSILVKDDLQTITVSNTLTIAVQSGETLNGITNGAKVLRVAGSWIELISDGVSGWTYNANNSLKITDLYLTGDQTTTSNVAVNITDLVLPLAINKTHKFTGTFRIANNNTGGIRFQLTVPTGATIVFNIFGATSSTSAFITGTTFTSATLFTTFVTFTPTSIMIMINGEVVMGSTAGSMQFGFASGVNTQTSTIFKTGTHLTVTQID